MSNRRLVLIQGFGITSSVATLLFGFLYTLGFLYGLYDIIPAETDIESSLNNKTHPFNTTNSYFDHECPPSANGYCLNGGGCFFSSDANGPARKCKHPYGGKRCDKYMWYN